MEETNILSFATIKTPYVIQISSEFVIIDLFLYIIKALTAGYQESRR